METRRRGWSLSPSKRLAAAPQRWPCRCRTRRAFPPDSAFDRAWALAVMDRTFAILQREFAEAGKTAHYEVLKPGLEGESAGHSQGGNQLAVGAERRRGEGGHPQLRPAQALPAGDPQ